MPAIIVTHREPTDPFRAYRFLVEVESFGSVVAAFSQFSGVQMQVDTLQVRAGDDDRGVQEYIPTLTRFAPVTLTKGVVRDNDFLDWLFTAAASNNAGPQGGDLRRTLNVVALDERGQPGITWSLKDALPIGYQLSPMDGSVSEVLSETLTFAITGMARQSHERQYWRINEEIETWYNRTWTAWRKRSERWNNERWS